MGKINLSLEVPDVSSCEKLRIKDSSFYDFKCDLEKGTLQIRPPGFDWVEFHEHPFFDNFYNSKSLKIQKGDCNEDLMSLPDGVWTINWMMGEDIKTVIQYYHLRNCRQMSCYKKVVCNLFEAECKLTRAEFEKQSADLMSIYQRILAAKWMVEEKGEKEEGMQLYNEAERMLNYYRHECGC